MDAANLELDHPVEESLDLPTIYEHRLACLNFCKGKGHAWAAIQGGWECNCGDAETEQFGGSVCFAQCKNEGNIDQVCLIHPDDPGETSHVSMSESIKNANKYSYFSNNFLIN